MQRYFYSLTWLLIIVGLGFLGYFAYTNLSHDFVYESSLDSVLDPDPVADTGATPEELGDTVETSEDTPDIETPTDDSAADTASAGSVPAEYAELGAELEALVNDYGGLMKVGSKGSRVGTIQKFLNIYNDKDINTGVDNDYGPGTSEKVKAFQSAEGLTADGQAGPGTYGAMLKWLEGQ